MFDQASVVTELLRKMIMGDYPLNLCAMRLCTSKLQADTHQPTNAEGNPHLQHALELIDAAQQFDTPPNLLRRLREEALALLEAASSVRAR